MIKFVKMLFDSWQGLVFLGIACFGTYGWILNVVNVVHSLDSEITALLVIEILGIPFAPIGVVLGFIFG